MAKKTKSKDTVKAPKEKFDLFAKKKAGEKKDGKKSKKDKPERKQDLKHKFGFDWQKHLPDHKFTKSNKK